MDISKNPQNTKPINTLKEKAAHKLTRKQKAFADALINDKKLSATQAALQTYGKPDKPTTYGTANDIARTNLQKPAVRSYLEGHSDMIEQTLINTVKDYGQSDDIKERTLAVNTGEWIHDKIHGKAKQQIDIRSQAITLNIDLTGNGTPEPTN